MKYQIIPVEGDLIEGERDEPFGLKIMQEAVGGYIEIIFLNDGRAMVLNEEGKLRRMPVNPRATAMTRDIGLAFDDLIVGQVLVCDRGLIE